MTRSMAASFFTRGCFARASATTFLVVVLLVLSPTPTRAKLPKNEDREVLCEACNATLAELSNLVAKTEKRAGGRESAVEDALETLCDDMYRFVTYAYPPPKMQKGCRVIVEEYADELSTLVYAKDERTYEKVCATPCEGVDVDGIKTRERTMEATVDGKPYVPGEGEL